jgi:hypothetical protein
VLIFPFVFWRGFYYWLLFLSSYLVVTCIVGVYFWYWYCYLRFSFRIFFYFFLLVFTISFVDIELFLPVLVGYTFSLLPCCCVWSPYYFVRRRNIWSLLKDILSSEYLKVG